MLYKEFLTGTGCRDNEHNYRIFENLNAMYMNTDMSKEEIYSYGNKLVNNDKSKKELELEKQANEHIEKIKKYIEYLKEELDKYTYLDMPVRKRQIKAEIAENRRKIRELKFIIS